MRKTHKTHSTHTHSFSRRLGPTKGRNEEGRAHDHHRPHQTRLPAHHSRQPLPQAVAAPEGVADRPQAAAHGAATPSGTAQLRLEMPGTNDWGK